MSTCIGERKKGRERRRTGEKEADMEKRGEERRRGTGKGGKGRGEERLKE